MNFAFTINPSFPAKQTNDSTIELSLTDDTVDVRYTLDTTGDDPKASLNADDMAAFYDRDDVSVGKLERGDFELYLVRVAEGLE